MRTKALNYAYPTSETANSLGYKSEGCWFVTIGLPCRMTPGGNYDAGEIIGHGLTADEVFNAWTARPEPVDRYCMTQTAGRDWSEWR